MGWWSATILGGDPAYDARGNFMDIMGLFESDDDGDHDHFWLEELPLNEYADRVNEHIDALIAHANGGVYGQVLGALIMETGAKMSDETRQFVLWSAHSDEWAQYNEERAGYINDFIEKVKAYPSEGGVVVEIVREGLFQKVFETIAEGKTGLINK